MKNNLAQLVLKKAHRHFSKNRNFLNLETFIIKHGGLLIYVGGVIRNIAVDQKINDYDAEVYMLSKQELEEVLQKYASKYDTKLIYVGIQFGVFKLIDLNIDIALPRQEHSIGPKHCDFDINFCPNIKYSLSSLRRDFKMNAIGYSNYYNLILDPHNGLGDIHNRVISIVNSVDTFLEDPLRLLRAIYFSNKLNFVLNTKLQALLYYKSYLLRHISIERIANEVYKTFNSAKPKYLNYFSLLRNHAVDILCILNELINDTVLYSKIYKLNTLQERVFFILMIFFHNQNVLSFFKKMPNHKEFELGALIILASVYNFSKDKNTKLMNSILRRFKEKTFYYRVTNVSRTLYKTMLFKENISYIHKQIQTYLDKIQIEKKKYYKK